MYRVRFEEWERMVIQAALEAFPGAKQRTLARTLLANLPNRTFASVYGKIRRLQRRGTWFNDRPVGHSLIA